MEYVVGLRSDPAEIGDEARRLEDLGYDGLGCGDHRPRPDARHLWSVLAAAALASARVRVVAMFAHNLFRRPAEFAQSALSLHEISGGRFEAGLGAGWAADDLAAIGQPLPTPRERVERFVEGCSIASALLRGEGVAFAGAHYRCTFPPTGVMGPPLIAAVGGKVTAKRIAPVVDRVEVMFGAAVAGGSLDLLRWRDLSREALSQLISIARSAAPTVRVGVGVFAAAGDAPDVQGIPAGEHGLQRELVGPPDQVAAALRSLEALGVDRVGITPLTKGTARELAPHLFG
jgi:alkanesulfonate monooxygenase SsuD/methylene tetrahydromethanopterin reductase-like flavin-dependent oxidoreductase (luciferase family)